MSGVNKVILIGRLGLDPESRMTPSGQQVCSLRVATSESWVKDGNREERTEWHRIVLWGRQAELATKYLRKGSNVYLEGRLQTRSWDDQQGQKRYTTEIVANTIQFLDSKGSGRGAEAGEAVPDYGEAPAQANRSSSGGGYGNSSSSSSSGGYDSPSPSGSTGSGFGTSRGIDLDDDVPF